MKLQLITIDLDGTLVDSVGDLHEAVVRMQDSIGHARSSEADVRLWVGNGIERLVHRALTGTMGEDADTAQFAPALAAFRQAYAQVNGTRSSLYPGVMEGLHWLRSLQIPLVMITNKAEEFALPLVSKLSIGKFFDQCIAGDNVTRKKPDPEALLLAAKRYSTQPGNSLMIGDSISDIRAARAAGFRCVSVSYGYNHGLSIKDLDEPSRPDAIMDSFDELPDILAALCTDPGKPG